ncbi:TPA: DUF814 domain-containing protein [Candidatus Woesearchaeota archaeon]|nr:DUF814 domain-containing protein [Candidatus Woesearchaeota archaeon]HIH31786.1 DUF814 domain-containing protein [Candidatus Woesearchaeota archaeon]HIH55334.1 DUF814 domain-containing protein [Candidatus Woesearchaeota archaeon]HIJ01859.1 DUF814 domain-containing protein [Candidatus Woesearchaeota archaeon]HIJ13814.1 DUF814 domain-containing protein [Candidatus Woesearchaeota archaeon]
MEIEIFLSKNVEQNAGAYFDRAKKLKKKIPGIVKTIEAQKNKLLTFEKQDTNKIEKAIKVKKEWYEKFRWFISSDGFLVIGGRDSTTNEIIIKKFLEGNDLVFHTELPGSPFVVIKNPESKSVPEQTILEAAEFCASFSKSWKSGRSNAEVYYINPDQVSKEAPSGTGHLARGSFMIYGKRNYLNVAINIGLCIYNDRVISGPIQAIKKLNNTFVEIIQGNDKLSDVAKRIRKILNTKIGFDEIIRALPPQCTIKWKKN